MAVLTFQNQFHGTDADLKHSRKLINEEKSLKLFAENRVRLLEIDLRKKEDEMKLLEEEVNSKSEIIRSLEERVIDFFLGGDLAMTLWGLKLFGPA